MKDPKLGKKMGRLKKKQRSTQSEFSSVGRGNSNQEIRDGNQCF